MKILGHTTVLIAIAIVFPFLIGFFMILGDINVATWIDMTPRNDSGEINIILFISTLIWLHSGWDCVSHLAGEGVNVH